MSHSEYVFFTKNEDERSWLLTLLPEIGFEGFEETNESLKAYIPTENCDELKVKQLLTDNDFQHLGYSVKTIEEKNWNEEWERNFEPVVVAGKVAIRAPFHPAIKAPLELVIEPKMSFGTGHHATTALMIEMLLKENPVNKTVLDFGSGTGVLAILAEKLGAQSVLAVDNEEWAFKNCRENMERNGCGKITAIQGDDLFVFDTRFELILANINRHVIMRNLDKWHGLLTIPGMLIVSGILVNDEQDVCASALETGFKLKGKLSAGGWLALAFVV
ncbi:MAG TPA: 50S ribosomal protein L11 methyltransferase [Chitinophagales bacterium]|nr:50S ribosomal protein L11 methyltransferase [Chitinophagales bacterium]